MPRRISRKMVALLLLFCRMRFKTPWLIAKSTDFLLRYSNPSVPEISCKESKTRISSWRQSSSRTSNIPINASVEIIIVSTSKDFEILKYTVDYAIKACANFNSISIKLIIPKQEIEQCKALFSKDIYLVQVINEEDILDSRIRERLRQFNPNRYGWCLQQFLKLKSSLLSQSDYCLILDSDTILLHPRQWVNLDGATLLLPSEEFHQPYFDLFSKLGMPDTERLNSFVSHHLLINPLILESILHSYFGQDALEGLIHAIEQFSDKKIASPFCVDYELYAQFATRTTNGLVFLQKWSNLGVSRRFSKRLLHSSTLLSLLSFFYSSISLHSWS